MLAIAEANQNLARNGNSSGIRINLKCIISSQLADVSDMSVALDAFSALAGTGGPRYMWSFYLQFCMYAIEKWPFSGTYPLIRSFYMQIFYMRAFFGVPIYCI